MTTDHLQLSDPLTLPCGAVIPNRLVKAAMTEGLATADGTPTEALERLYGFWSEGGAGLLISGNIQVDYHHVERPGNVILESTASVQKEAFLKWTKAGTRAGNHFWAQLSHGGRQVERLLHPNPKGPSAVPMDIPLKFGTPVALTVEEIDDLVQRFANAAEFCQQVGFTGIQIHSAHGYLLSSFLSPRANIRTDDYGGSLANRARFLSAVVGAIRKSVGPSFPISVKLNSADFQRGGFQFEDSLQVAQWLEEAGVDLIEISGGNVEQGAMMNLPGLEARETPDLLKHQAPSTQAREVYFVEFAKAMRKVIKKVPLMVTGGFRNKAAMEWALESGAADLIGLARPLCVMPDVPLKILDGKLETLPSYELSLGTLPWSLRFLKRYSNIFKVIDTIPVVFWFFEQIEQLGQHGKPNTTLTPFRAVLTVEGRNRRMLAERSRSPPTPINAWQKGVTKPLLFVAISVAFVGIGAKVIHA